MTALTQGADGNLWIAGQFPIPQPAFARFNNTGGYLSTLNLPSQVSWVNDAVLGPDNAIWFVDGQDSLVGRISQSGAVTTYHTPTQNADPLFITVGGDGALWFSEFTASKVGRITTSGQMTEYTLPTANSGPYQIVGPKTAGCAPMQLWVAEQSSGKIAQLFIKT
jgi:virginiamycin B lyase